MNILEKYHLEKIIKAFNEQSTKNQFYMFFDLKGKRNDHFTRIRSEENIAIRKAIHIFVRIYKNRFEKYFCEEIQLYRFTE